VKKKHFIFIIKNKNKNRKHIKINNKKDKSFLKELKHEPNIVEITHLCIMHGAQTSYDLISSWVHSHFVFCEEAHRQFFWNMMGTWEKRKNSSPPPSQKEKNCTP
jgi:hypothetical protein